MKNKNSFLRETHKRAQGKPSSLLLTGLECVWKEEEAIPSPVFLSPLPDDNLHSIRGCSYVFDYLRT